MTASFRHIVLGSGGIGSATAHWLGRTGADVLVLEQYGIGHGLGASEDHSRIIRHAYDSAAYTALTQAAFDTWAEIERATGLTLVTRTGGLNLFEGEGAQAGLGRYVAALDTAGHPYEVLAAGELMRRFPQWRLPRATVSLHQQEAGILDIRKANAAHVALARSSGVTFLDDTPVVRVDSRRDHVEVVTARGTFRGETLSVCAGSWTGPLLAGLGVHVPITLTQEQVTYFSTPNLREFAPDRFGVWVYVDDVSTFYGFPVYGEAAVKAGRDEPGTTVTQQTRSWEPDPANRAQLAAFLAARLPGALGPELMTKTCVYDLTPDRNFLIDLLPGHPRIGVFVGAGHAAKFASLAGRVMADLATSGGTDWPIGAFAFDRPAITDPAFVPTLRLSGLSMPDRVSVDQPVPVA